MMKNQSFDSIKPDRSKAIMIAKRELSTFVYDAVQLEGINLTLPEVQTLLEGVTVGGHKLNDQQIAINQGAAWRMLFADIEAEKFTVAANYAKNLHAVAAKEEALEWGDFRSGGVTIAGTDYVPPAAALLPDLFISMVATMKTIEDSYDQAIFIFLAMSRNQFFYDVNKRMGRFMMNGILLAAGYPAINVPVKRKQEFNQLMLDFYSSNKPDSLNLFLRSCLDPRVIQIMSE